MMGKRLLVAAALATLLASAGCRSWCEHHGYYPAAPAPAYGSNCCVPCCPCAPAPAGYAAPAPASSWATPAPPPPAATCPTGCVPAGR